MGTQGDLDDAARQRLVRLALSDWSTAADARVNSVIVSTKRVAVNLFVNGDYEYVVFFQRNELGHWDDSGSSSGHVDQAHMDAQG